MWTADGAQTGYKEISIKMESREYYDMLFKENRENHWDDAPGKKVILSASINLINEQANNILDIGCGNGYFIGEIEKCNRVKDHEQNYYGIDISTEAVKKANERYDDINFYRMDAMSLDFGDEYFDIVLSYGAIEHVRKPEIAIKEIQRVLKNDGLFLMMVPALDYYRNDRTDEGWYEDLDSNRQLQWNYLRETWEEMFKKVGLKLFNVVESKKYGALKTGVFFFGNKEKHNK